jgi:hypothetical protein
MGKCSTSCSHVLVLFCVLSTVVCAVLALDAVAYACHPVLVSVLAAASCALYWLTLSTLLLS